MHLIGGLFACKMLTLAQDMERAMNALLLDVEFSNWPLLETLIAGYEDAFLGSLETSFVTQLYPTIYGDDFPDILLQNVFPPPKPVVALAGESKFIYSALDGYKASSLHFRMNYIKRHAPKSAALMEKSSTLADDASGFKQVPQERVPNLPSSKGEAEKSYFQGFPAKSAATLRKPQAPAPSSVKHLSSNDRLALFNRRESERRSTASKNKFGGGTLGRSTCIIPVQALGPLSGTGSAIKYIDSTARHIKDSAYLSASNLSAIGRVTEATDTELHLIPSNFQSSPQSDLSPRSLQTPGSICNALGTSQSAELHAALVIQSVYRMLTRRTWFVTIRLAALAFQAHFRGSLARSAYTKRRAEIADRARNDFLKDQEAFIAKLSELSMARRSSSAAYDAFIFAKHKYNEPIVSYFMPVCYDRVERVFFDSARSLETGSLEIRPRKYTIPIVLLSTPASIGGESTLLFNSYSTPSMGFSFCPVSLVHFLLDPTVLRLIVVAEHPVSLKYIESILAGITQESMLLKRNQVLHSLIRYHPSPDTSFKYGSPLRADKTHSVTPGPQVSQNSPTPLLDVRLGQPSKLDAIPAPNGQTKTSVATNQESLFLPAQLAALVKTKLVVIHPTLLSTLEADAFEGSVKLSYTGSVASLLLSSPDTIEDLKRAVDKACLEVMHQHGTSKNLEVLPYFSSNIDSISDFDIYSLNRTFGIPTTMLLHSQRVNCRDHVLTCIHQSQIFTVESITELHQYLKNEHLLDCDTEYIIAPFAPGAANVFSEAVLSGLAGIKSYCLTRESKRAHRIMLCPILPITDTEQPHAQIVSNICADMGVGDYYILSAKKVDLRRPFVAARLIIYIELSEKPIVTYLGSSVDISSPLAGTSLPTRSFGTMSPAPDFIYFTLKKQSASTITKLIDYGVHGMVVLHYLYAESVGRPVEDDQRLSNISMGSASMRTISSTKSPSIKSPITQSMSVSPTPFQALSMNDYIRVYDSEVAHFSSLLSPTNVGSIKTRPPCSSLNMQVHGDDSVSLSANGRLHNSRGETAAILVNISFGFTPGVCHLHSAMALGDLSWDSINGVLSRNDVSLLKKQVTKVPMVVLSLPFLWHRDLRAVNRASFMTALMKEGIVFDSLTRTGTLFDWNPESSSFGVFGIYQDPLLAVQRMARLVDIALSTIHNAHPISVSSVATKLNSLHCESEINGKTYARLRMAHMSTNLQDCGAALKAMLPYLQPVNC